MKVRWRRNAQLDLAEIDAHIRQENPQAANRVVSAIRQGTVQLASTPLVGRLGRVENTRELVMAKHPFIIAYQGHAFRRRNSCRDLYRPAVA